MTARTAKRRAVGKIELAIALLGVASNWKTNMKLELRSADISAALDGASNGMIVLEKVDMELWMVRNFLCEVAENWSIEDINEILNTTSLRIRDIEATPNAEPCNVPSK